MSLVHLSKAAIAGIATAALASTGAVAWTVVDHGTNHTSSAVRTVDGSLDTSRSNVSGLAGGAVNGTSGSVGADGSGSGANGSASASNGGTSTGATGGVTGGGSPAAAGGIAVNTGGAGASIDPGATGTPAVNGTGVGTGTGGLPAVGTGGTGLIAPTLPGTSVTVPPTPGVPSVPDGVALYREGSYTLTVPGTPGVAKKLCLNGEVTRCESVTVPALQPTSVTVSYAANASASAPSFDVIPCQGGLGVAVSGITPGTTVTVQARGVTLSRTLGSREVSQSASLCDA